MKFTVWKTSDNDYVSEIEINSIEQLIEFKKQVRHNLILRKDYTRNHKNEWALEIYDGYRE